MRFKNKTILLLIMLVFFALRLPGLGTDISNSDAARWHRRSERFINAFLTGDFAATYQHYQPGITISWLDGAVNRTGFFYQNKMKGLESPKTLENSDYYPLIHGVSKMFLVFLLGVLLIYQAVLVARVFGERVALFFALFMAVEPYMVGIDRWFHLTSLETYFAFSSLLSLIYWYKYTEAGKKFLLLSAVLLALSVLSKLTTLLTLPLYFYIFALRFSKKRSADMMAFAAVFAVTFFILFPALWADPLVVLTRLYNAAFNAVTNNIRAEIISPLLLPVYYPVMIGLKLSPISLMTFIFTILYYRKVSEYEDSIFIFINLALYFSALTISEQKIDRYITAMIPSILLLSALLISKLRLKVRLLAVLVPVVFAGYVAYVYHPVYSAYYSPLFGGTKTALALDLYDNSGEYYAQAADYLNKMDRNSQTYLPYNLEAFSYFYNGIVQRSYDENTDFIVTSVNHLDDVDELSACSGVFKTFGSKENEIVYIYSCNDKTK